MKKIVHTLQQKSGHVALLMLLVLFAYACKPAYKAHFKSTPSSFITPQAIPTSQPPAADEALVSTDPMAGVRATKPKVIININEKVWVANALAASKTDPAVKTGGLKQMMANKIIKKLNKQLKESPNEGQSMQKSTMNKGYITLGIVLLLVGMVVGLVFGGLGYLVSLVGLVLLIIGILS